MSYILVAGRIVGGGGRCVRIRLRKVPQDIMALGREKSRKKIWGVGKTFLRLAWRGNLRRNLTCLL